MAASHIVVTSGPKSAPPRRSISLKLRGGETGESIMMFEETIPTGTKTSFHLHHDSDEVAYVLSGEVTFKIGDEITVGGPGTCTFMPRGIPHAWMSTPSSLALPVKSKSYPPRRARFDEVDAALG